MERSKASKTKISQKKPNILYIVTDQHRYDCLSCMGHEILKTPNIDRLAKEGITFTTAYCPSPVCAPSRAAVFSGQYPPGCGVVDNWVPFNGEEILLSEHLKNAGYETASVGKLHFVPHQKRWGFDYKVLNDAPYSVYADDDRYSDYVEWLESVNSEEVAKNFVELFDQDERQWPRGNRERFILGRNFIPEEYHMTTWTARQTLHYLETRSPGKPFFLHVSFFGPHQPWDPPGKWRNLYDPGHIELPQQFDARMKDSPIFQATRAEEARENKERFTKEDYKRIIAAYYGNISMIDYCVGTIFHRLMDLNLWDDTMILFSSDHGDHNGQYGLFFKGDMYESAVHVPLVIKPAGGKKRRERCNLVVNTLDLYGTMLDAAGAVNWKSEKIEAGSLTDVIDDTDNERRKKGTFSIIGRDPDYNLTMLRREDHKLIRLSQGPQKKPIYELYDMRENPFEVNNLFEEKKHTSFCKDLVEALDNWWLEQKEKYPPRVISYCKVQ